MSDTEEFWSGDEEDSKKMNFKRTVENKNTIPSCDTQENSVYKRKNTYTAQTETLASNAESLATELGVESVTSGQLHTVDREDERLEAGELSELNSEERMVEAESGSVSLFPVSNKVQARMNLLKEVIESQKSEVRRIGGEMRSLIKKKENEIIKELDSIWNETNARIDREKEDVQKKFDEIEKRNIEMKKNYDEMNQILEQMDRSLPPLPQISEALETAKRELNISIPHLNLSWRANVLRKSINRMCRVEQVFREEEDTPFSSLLEISVEKEKTVTDQAEIGMDEASRKEERERRLEMELDEWKNRYRILEQSMKTADNEKEILKREIDQLKSKLREAHTKQTNSQVVEELKLSLVRAKKEMEVLRTETKETMQQSEQLEQERRKQDLEKLKQTQTEVESCERAASGIKEIFQTSLVTGRTKQAHTQEMEEPKETKERLRQSEQLEQERRNQDLEKLEQTQTEVESYKTSPIRKTSTAHDQVMLFQKGGENRALEESKHSTPSAVPRVFRHPSSSNGDGIERYNPDVLTVFLNKTTRLIYNTSSIKTTKLLYIKSPDSHRSKQVLVLIKGELRVGYLKAVFSRKHSFHNKTEMMAGILLQEPVGTSNGVYESTRRFDCPDNHAVFVLINEVYVPLI